MRIVRNTLIGLAALLAVLVVLLLLVDLGRFKDAAEDAVSDMLGREFTIGGQFQVQIGRKIYILAEDVRLADADWSSSDAFASVGRFEGSIDAWSLIWSPMRIEKLRVDKVRVNLSSNESGQNNWDFFPADESEDDQSRQRPTLPVILVDALVTDLVLAYDAPQRPQPLIFTATEIRAVETAAALRLDLSGDINETPLELSASAGVVENLVNFEDVEFDVSGRLGEIRFESKAAVDDVLQPRRPTVSVRLQGPNAEYLTDTLRLQRLTTGPLDLSAMIVPVDSKMQLVVNGVFGEFALQADGHFVDLQDLREVDLSIAASGPDTSAIARLFGNDSVPADPFNIVGKLQRSGTALLIDDIKVTVGESEFDLGGRFDNFPDPRAAQMAVRIDGPDIGRFNRLLGLRGKLSGPFTVDAGLMPLADGRAAVTLKAVAQDMQLEIAADVSERSDFVGTRAEITAAGPNLQTVTTALGLEQAPAESFELRVELERVAEGVKISTGTLVAGNDRVSLQGLLGNNPAQADTYVEFDIAIPNLERTLTAFGRDADELPQARFQANGRIARGVESFELKGVQAFIGDNRDYSLNINGQLSLESNFLGSKIEVSAKGNSLGALTDAAGVEGMPNLPFEMRGTISRLANGYSVEDGNARLGDDQVTLRGLIADRPLQGDTEVSFAARAPDLKASLQRFGVDNAAVPAGPLDASGEIRYQGKYFAVEKLQATLAGAQLRVAGRFGSLPELEGTKLTVQLDGADFSRLLPDEPEYSALKKPFGLSATVSVRDKDLSLDKVSSFIGDLKLTADVELRLSSVRDKGSFSIDANSPDLFRLVPQPKESSLAEQAPLAFHTEGKWVDNLWTLDKLSLQLGTGTLAANGIVDGPPNFKRTDLQSTLNITSMRSLSALAGRELPDEAAQLKLHLVGSDEAIMLKEFSGTSGVSDISGEFMLRSGDVQQIRFSLKSRRLNLAPYLPELAKQEPPKKGSEAKSVKADRVIPDTVIPMDVLAKYRGSADIDIAELNLRHRTLRDVIAVGAVEGGALKLTKFNIKSSRDEVLTGQLDLRPGESGAELVLAMQGSALAMGLPALTVEDMQALPRYDVDAVISGVGVTVREMAGSLNGYVRVIAGSGDIKTGALAFLTNDFLFEVLNTVNPFAKADVYTHYKCAAILLRLKDGIVKGEPAAVLRTDRLRIFANTTIDLKSEKLSATIRTVPTKGLGISFSDLINPYTMISGTLAHPSLILDPKGVVVEGGAAVATGGISFLAKRFKDRFLSAEDPCGKAVADVDEEFQALKESYYPEVGP